MRNTFLPSPDSLPFRQYYDNTGIYRSAFAYQSFVENRENVYDSAVFGDFYMDFDSDEDILLAKKDVLQAIYLMSQPYRYHLPLEAFHIFFSGKKGFHVIIPWKYFGFEPDFILDEIFRSMARDIKEFCTYDTLDMSVYERRRILRMENSIHEKTGLHKIPLTYEELKKMTGPEIEERATNNYRIKYEKPYLINRANQIYQMKQEEINQLKYKPYTGTKKPLDFTPSCIQHLLDQGPTKGQRNNTMAVLASFFRNQGLDIEQTEEELRNWALPAMTGQDPVRASEIKATTFSIYSRGWNYGCKKIREIAPCEGATCPLFKEEE